MRDTPGYCWLSEVYRFFKHHANKGQETPEICFFMDTCNQVSNRSFTFVYLTSRGLSNTRGGIVGKIITYTGAASYNINTLYLHWFKNIVEDSSLPEIPGFVCACTVNVVIETETELLMKELKVEQGIINVAFITF